MSVINLLEVKKRAEQMKGTLEISSISPHPAFYKAFRKEIPWSADTILALAAEVESLRGSLEIMTGADRDNVKMFEIVESVTKKNEKLTNSNKILREAHQRILSPIECPACSMDMPSDGVPCYCYEEFNSPAHISKKAIAESDEVLK